jgi:hypothetical protein
MADNRTGPAVQKVVEAVQEDLGDAINLLQRGLDRMRELEGHAKGINGLASTLKAKSTEVELVISVLREESEGVAKKMLTEPREPIRQSVDHGKVEEVRASKATG